MLNHKLTVLTLITIVMLVVLPIEVNADDTWSDALLFYLFTTTVQENIRNITNTASFPIKVTVSYVSAENISRIKFYKLSANGTNFVKINDGAVAEYSNSYEPLDIGKTLVFTVYAKPTDTIMQNETASVSVKVQAESVETGGGPWYPLVETPEITCTLDTSPNVQLSFGQLLANRFNIHYVVSITKKSTQPLNITMRTWITDLNDYHVVYYLTNKSLFVTETNITQTQAYDIQLPCHFQASYVLHIAFDYENTTTQELLATINVDSSHAIIQIVVIAGSVITLALVMYVGLFRRQKKTAKKEGEEIREILTFQ